MRFKEKQKVVRRVFGFPCDPELALSTKVLAKLIPAPIFPTAEHILQLGGAAVAIALQDEQSRKDLEQYILREHLLVPDINIESAYDIKVLVQAKLLELRRQEFEEFTKEFMKVCDQEDINPWFLLTFAKRWVKDLWRRRLVRGDIPRWDNPL